MSPGIYQITKAITLYRYGHSKKKVEMKTDTLYNSKSDVKYR